MTLHRLQLLVTAFLCVLLSLFSQSMQAQDCDFIEVYDLRYVPGFAQTDSLVLCGVPDTLALLVFTPAADQLQGVSLTAQLPDGMQYAGFQESIYENTSISLVSDSDPQNPEFLLSNLDQFSSNVIYIGVQADCDFSSATDLQLVNYQISYVDPANNFCVQDFAIEDEFDGAFSSPVLNINPNVDPVNLVFQNFGETKCQTVIVSQDGFDAYVSEFDFSVSGVQLGAGMTLASISVNQMAYTDEVYDPASRTYTIAIDNSYFPANTGGPTVGPNDNLFNENERVEIELCYTFESCPSDAQYFMSYQATYGCLEQQCEANEPTQVGSIKINPNFGADPEAQLLLVQEPTLCGQEAIFQWSLDVPNPAITNPEGGILNDLNFMIRKLCSSNIMTLKEVTLGNTVLNAGSEYTLSGDTLYFDFDALVLDPDGPDLGLEATDDDGLFNDLPYGNQITGTLSFDVICQDGSICETISCAFDDFTLSGTRHCGNLFDIDDQFDPTPTAIIYGVTDYHTEDDYATDIFDETRGTPGPGYTGIMGFDFTHVDFNQSGTGDLPAITNFGFAYTYTEQNINGCSDSRTYLEVTVSGNKYMNEDYELIDGTLTFDGQTYDNATAIISDSFPDAPADSSRRVIIIDLGSADPGRHNYSFDMALDACLRPVEWGNVNFRVIQECLDASCTCETIVACESFPVQVDYEGCGPGCRMNTRNQSALRNDYGTSCDGSTELSVSTADNPSYALDCDTMDVHVCYDVNVPLVMDRLNLYLYFYDPSTGKLGYMNGLNSYPETPTDYTVTYYDVANNSVVDLTDCNTYPWTAPGAVTNGNRRTRQYLRFHDSSCFGSASELAPGDSICVDVRFPIKATIPADDGDNPNFRSFIYVSEALPDGSYYHAAPCAEYDPIRFHDPVVSPNLVYDVNDCFIDVTHTLSVGALPPNWYEDEYRIFDIIKYAGVPILEGTYYEDGTAQVIQPDGTVYDLTPDSTTNVSCPLIAGKDYCFSDVGNTGKMYFSANGMSPPATNFGELGIGCASADVWTLKYRLGIACPLTPDYTGVEWEYFEQQLSCESLSTSTNFNPINNTSAPSPLDGIVSIPVLISSGDTEVNRITVCNDAANDYVHQNIGATITLPYNIALETTTDAISGLPYTFTATGSTATENTYLIEFNGDLAATECWELDIETRLLFCPAGVPTAEISLTVFSGCLEPDVRADLNVAGFSAEACAESQLSYLYSFVPSDLQISVYEEPTPPVQLCDEFEYTILIKNVKEGRNGSQLFNFFFPTPGVEPIAGTWQVAYPFGPAVQSPFVPFANDPTLAAVGAYGEQLSTDISNVDAWLTANGIPGVFEFNAESTDSNKLAIKFKARTNCDGFTSGTPFRFDVVGYDACGFATPTSLEVSQPLVVDGADPEDFAQFVTFADPVEVNCEGESLVNVTAVNLSQTTESDSQSTIKLVIPEGVDYVPGTINYNTPAGFVPDNVVVTQNASGLWEILMDIPAGLGEAELFNFSFEADFDPSAECGNYPMQVSIRSRVDGITCVETNELCSVFVEQGRNSIVDLFVVPALALQSMTVYDECSENPDEISLSYDILLNNIGADYLNKNVLVDIYQDIDGNSLLDPSIDPLLATETQLLSVLAGEDILFSSTMSIPINNACPLLAEISFDSSCECHSLVHLVDDIKPNAVREIGNAIGLCDANGVDLPYCETYEHFFLGQDVEELIYTDNGDGTINLSPTENFVGPAIFGIQAQYGICANYTEGFAIYNLADYVLDLGPDQEVCTGECTTISFDPPFDDLSNVEISWTPELYLDNSDSDKVKACVESNITYTVTMTLPGGCVFTDDIFVQALPPAEVEIESGATSVCASGAPVQIAATPGFAAYTFYVSNPAGPDIVVQAGPLNTYDVTSAGEYFVKASTPGTCPGTSQPWLVIEDPCYACLGDTTWVDCNNNGLQDLDESPLSGVAVALYTDDGTYLGSQVTNGQGYYLFDEVPPNDSYYLIFNSPSGLQYTVSNGSVSDTNNSDANALTGQTAIVTVGDNECLYYLDAGYTPSELPGIDESNYPEVCQGESLELCVTETWAAYQWYQATDPLNPDHLTDNPLNGEDSRCFAPEQSGTYYALVTGTYCDIPTATIEVVVHDLPAAELTASAPTTFCEGKQVLLTATPADALNYDFILNGTTLVQTGANDQYFAQVMGDYTVVVTDANGCTSTSEIVSVTVNPNPQPGYVLNGPATFCDPGEISIEIDAGFDNYNFFVDGVLAQSGTTASLVVTSTSTVVVEVRDASGCVGTTTEILIEVLPQPKPFIYAQGPTTFCEGGEVLLTVIGTYAQYQWYKDGFLIPGAAASVYQASESGLYTVFVDDLSGCSGTTTSFEVVVNPLPFPEITSEDDFTLCQEDSPLLLEGTPGYDQYDWYLNGVLLLQSGPLNLFEANQDGVYSVSVTDANGCSATSPAVQVDLYSHPVIDLDVLDNEFCFGESTQLTASGGSVYSWTPDDGTLTCTDCADPIAMPTQSTTYTVEVTNADGCSSTKSVQVNVNPLPEPNLSIAEAEICEGEQTILTATPGFEFYTFYNDGIIVQQGTTNEYLTGVPGQYLVVVRDSESCSGASNEASLIVHPLPEGSLTAQGEPALCEGQQVTLQASPGFDSYNWYFEGELIPLQSADYLIASVAGSYWVEVLDSYGCSSTFNEIEVTVAENPTPVILIQGLTESCPGGEVVLNVAGQYAALQWFLDGLPIAGATSPVLLAEVPGSYTVEGVTAAGCSGPSLATQVNFFPELMPQVLLQGNNPKCSDESVELSLGAINLSNVTWYLDGIEQQSGSLQNFIATEPGFYHAIFEDSNGCTGESTAIQVLEEACIFDLALMKTLADGQSASVTDGDDVTFTITIFNQGDMDAYAVEIIDYIPAGFSLNDADWQAVGPNALYQLSEVLPRGQQISVDITLTVTSAAAAGPVTNFAEVASALDQDGNPGEDIDSTPDLDPDNDGSVEDNITDGSFGDQDDHDPATVFVEVFDLALTKSLAVDQSSVVSIGDEVNFTITVYNQGNVDAYNVLITDYLPAGLTLQDTDWNSNGSQANTVLEGPILAGSSTTVDITLMVTTQASGGALINFAEISDAEDEAGDHPTDADSVADNNNGNDAGGMLGTDSDDAIDGDATGSPGEENDYNDEDDHDPASVTVAIFDLALTKTLSPGQQPSILPGEDVDYMITITNQGSVDAYNVSIIDYIPSGLILNDSDWTQVGSDAMTVIEGPIPAFGGIDFVEITLQVEPSALPGELVNYAEIADAEDANGEHPQDEDSSADTDSQNDAGGAPDSAADNETSGDGTGLPGDSEAGTDEDDHDPESILVGEVFDLALTKVLAEGQAAQVELGEDVTYTLIVENQGNIDATDIVLVDYLPSGLVLNDPNWTAVGTDATITLTGPISPMEQETINITVTVTEAGDLTNFAEIADAQDGRGNHLDDIDSTADSDDANDGPVTDNSIDGSNGDEDDHDPAVISVVDRFDLALTKMLAPGQPALVSTGDLVSYIITVYNQGTIDAYNVDIVDIIPDGLILSDENWTAVGPNAITTLPGPIPAGESSTFEIRLTVTASAGSLTNVAEITDAEDETGAHPSDVDSTPDIILGNDAGGNPESESDDSINGDGSGQPGDDEAASDEDDSDPATVHLQEPFDLALTKELADGQSSYVSTGDEVEYTITVFNQGNVAAYNISIVDYIPDGMLLTDADWIPVPGAPTYLIPGPLDPGSSISIDIMFTVTETENGSLVNYAEISSAQNVEGEHPEDVDSRPDNTNGNDAGGTAGGNSDDVVTGDGTGVPGGDTAMGDEDDHDPAIITIENAEEVFDLALVKTLSAGQESIVSTGDDVTYTISIFNQGTIDAFDVHVVDYIPIGMTLSDSEWSLNGDQAEITIPGPIEAGSSASVQITMTVSADSGSLINYAEVADAQDINGAHPNDHDSTPDADPTNDSGGDPNGSSNDQTGGDGTGTTGSSDAASDEDDHDPELVTIQDEEQNEEDFDLALTKTLAQGEDAVVLPGEDVTFVITVFNQGMQDVYDVEIIDYIPDGLMLNDSEWTEFGADAIASLDGPIPAGGQELVEITLTVTSSMTGDISNLAEIMNFSDEFGNHPPDADSNPDGNPDNDGPAVNDETAGTNGDEDDQDFETITVQDEVDEQIFDLALTKTLAEGQSPFVASGELATFTITVYNQGDLPAYNVNIVDYIPSGLDLADNDWTGDGSIANTNIPGPLEAGASTEVPITLRVNGDSQQLTNFAEISHAEDENGEILQDHDSTADSNPDNDAGGQPESEADNAVQGDGTGATGGVEAATDEDDSDPASLQLYSFDLALTKSLSAGQTSTVSSGDLVSYTISVYNQGTVEAYQIEVVDYIPSGLQLADSDWSSSDGQTATTTIDGPLLPNEQIDIEVTMLVVGTSGSLSNIAEISDALDVDGEHPEDIDSTPDNNPNNDPGGAPSTSSDDAIDGDGTGSPGDADAGSDEDDSDPAEIFVSPNFDLALTKTLAAGQSNVVSVGDEITFIHTVYNQGSIAAHNIRILDYIPDGLILVDEDWSTENGVASFTLPGPISPGGSGIVPITFEVTATSGTIVNLSEIADAQDESGNHHEDSDSTSDDDPNNDGPAVDNSTDGTDGDEDDSDLEQLTVVSEPVEPIFDLALVKQLASNQTSSFEVGDEVTFVITVFNQGNVDAHAIEIVDHLPVELVLSDSDWTSVEDQALMTFEGPLEPGNSIAIPITCTIISAGQITNFAEIAGAEDPIGNDPDDIDSDPDFDSDNDGPVIDDSTDGTQGDEDDSDLEVIMVDEVEEEEYFDLALIKQLASGQPNSWFVGDEVTFIITVLNQGNVAATQIDLVDYLPNGLALNDSDWGLIGDQAWFTISGPIGPGTSVAIPITCTITSAGEHLNFAEISDAEDINGNSAFDQDSTPDNNPDNDGTAIDDTIDGNEGDEDDHDFEALEVNPAIFDLALVKSLAEGQAPLVSVGEAVTFDITVYNQGDIAAHNVQIVDYIPQGLSLADADWILNNGLAQTTISGPIAPGASERIQITFAVLSGAGEQQNIAEIADAQDEDGNHPPDVDSNADTNPDNDGPIIDNETDNSLGDEDDSDEQVISITDTQVFDLALQKTLAEGQAGVVSPGDLVVYTIEVFNQGNAAVYNVGIIDYLPEAFTLQDSNWQLDNEYPVTVIPGPIEAGQSASVNITVILDEAVANGELQNFAEITSAEDELGNPIVDIDSVSDTSNDNDGEVKDDETSGANGDEDDHDTALIAIIKELADLSITKVASVQSAATGEQITYQLSVSNAGPGLATGVVVQDLLPAGTQFVSADSETWDREQGIWKIEELEAGQTAYLNIVVQITAIEGAILNLAEVISADQADPNSTPNNSSENPDPSDPNQGEDDEAIAVIEVEDVSIPDPLADISLTKTVSNPTPLSDELIIYTISVTNESSIEATGLVVKDLLPEGLNLLDASSNNYDAQSGLWTIGTLAAGKTELLEILAEVTATEGEIVNFAEVVASDQTDPDSSPDNGSASADPSIMEDDEDTAIIEVRDCTLQVSNEIICETSGETYMVIVAVNEPVTVTGDYNGVVENSFEIGPLTSGVSYQYSLTSADGCVLEVAETPTDCIKLDLQLISFHGIKRDEGNLLTWISSGEREVESFVLSRSIDGFDFEDIYAVPAQGTPSTEFHYQHLDPYTGSGHVYYKLEEVTSNSMRRELDRLTLSRELYLPQILSVVPQPAKDKVVVTFSYGVNAEVELQMFDATGRLISAKITRAEMGVNTLSLDLSAYSQGVYFLKISGQQHSMMHKVIKQ